MYQADIPSVVRDTLRALMGQSLARHEPLAVSRAIDAIRRDHRSLELSDSDLINIIVHHAAAANITIEDDVQETNRPGALERWDNEGGAIKKKLTEPERNEAQRRVRNDTDGTQRRERETSERNRLI